MRKLGFFKRRILEFYNSCKTKCYNILPKMHRFYKLCTNAYSHMEENGYYLLWICPRKSESATVFHQVQILLIFLHIENEILKVVLEKKKNTRTEET